MAIKAKTQHKQGTTDTPTPFLAFELGVNTWKLGSTTGPAPRTRVIHRMRGLLAGCGVCLALLLIAWFALGVTQIHAASPPAVKPAEVWPVEAAFREAVQLWADERFEALWERGLLASRYRVSREVFVRGMRHRVVKPTCCWGQLRTIRVHLQGAEEAVVAAQVGVDVRTLGTTAMRSMLVYLRREEGVWRVSLEDFLTKPEVGLPRGLGWAP